MATFSQWRRCGASLAAVRRVTWVCGPEPVLAAEVVATTRGLMPPGAYRVLLVAGSDPEGAIWEQAAQFSPGQARLVVVREAHRLARWQRLEEVLAARQPGCYLVLVSPEEQYWAKPPKGQRSRKRALLPGPAAVQASPAGQIVHCTLPAAADRVAWVRSRAPVSAALAQRVLDRAGGDLAAAAVVCAKARLFGVPSLALIEELCGELAGESFADHLIYGQPRKALLAAPGEVGPALGLLGVTLGTLSALYAGQEDSVPQNLRAKYARAARHYSPARVRACFRLLAEVDSAYRSGVREGLPEVLAALW